MAYLKTFKKLLELLKKNNLKKINLYLYFFRFIYHFIIWKLIFMICINKKKIMIIQYLLQDI